MKTYLLASRMNYLKYFLFLLICCVSFSVYAQKKSKKPGSVQEYRRMELEAYDAKMKSGNDSIYIEFIYRTSIKDSVTMFASNGWYKSPLAARENPVLINHMLIIPSQQSLQRELTVSAFTHEMKKPQDFTYPRLYRNKPLKSPENVDIVNGVMDGVYMREDTMLREFEKEHKNLLDSTWKLQENYRAETMQPLVSQLLQPFYFSQTEVTNNQYRQFVNWVRDSIAMRMIYLGVKDSEEAVKWLNIDKKQAEKIDLTKREENLKQFGLNYNLVIDYEDEIIIPIVKSMYYPQPERFYKRREMDVRQFIYVKTNGDTISIFPDTISLVRSFSFHDPLTNMYFWHPAYDNYPILGLSYEQAMAYCEWYQKQVNESLKEKGYQAEVRIPTLFEYEMAAKYNLAKPGKHQIVNQPNDAYFLYIRPAGWEENAYLSWVRPNFEEMDYEPGEAKRYQASWKYNNWLQSNISSPIFFLNGNASEFCSTPITPEMIAYYKVTVSPEIDLSKQVLLIGSNFREDVIDLKGNQKNALFYKQVVPKTKTAATHGFRTVIYLSKVK